MRPHRSLFTVVATIVMAVALTACFTGKRGHLAPAAPAVTDPALVEILGKLATATPTQFTATYTLLTKFGQINTNATVTQNTATTRSITIGNVRYLTTSSGGQTCMLSTGVCTPTLDDQDVSNLSLTHDFFQVAPAIRIRQDATSMIKAAALTTKQIAGQTATCAELAFAAGNKTYCVLDDGLLAQQDTPDLRIDLVSVTPTSDNSLFSSSTVATDVPTTLAG
ncbi:MAG TPA: hypothetical protein VGM78_05755 [Ilumatobacteraceae bacterium]